MLFANDIERLTGYRSKGGAVCRQTTQKFRIRALNGKRISLLKMLYSRLKNLQLTGDVVAEADRISTVLKIPVLAAKSLPQEKQEWIRALQDRGHKVAMVCSTKLRSPSVLTSSRLATASTTLLPKQQPMSVFCFLPTISL